MDWKDAILHVIDLRSFSSLWYWIAVAVLWSTVSHWVIGVPYDMVQRAKRLGGQSEIDLQDLVRINVNRQLSYAGAAGIWLMGFLCFVLTMLAALGFWYRLELAQAVFLMALPMSIVGALALSTSRLIAATEPEGEALWRILSRHRIFTQIVGMGAIFMTALYGMFHNLSVLQSF